MKQLKEAVLLCSSKGMDVISPCRRFQLVPARPGRPHTVQEFDKDTSKWLREWPFEELSEAASHFLRLSNPKGEQRKTRAK